MNIQQRNSNFLSLTAKLLKPDHVKAVAAEIGCPEWDGERCDGSECFCEKAARAVLKLEEAK